MIDCTSLNLKIGDVYFGTCGQYTFVFKILELNEGDSKCEMYRCPMNWSDGGGPVKGWAFQTLELATELDKLIYSIKKEQ